jgi:uncharacterized protein
VNDLLVAIGLVLVLEGLIWAISPASALRMLVLAAQTPEGRLRVFGAIAAGIGVLIVGVVRG